MKTLELTNSQIESINAYKKRGIEFENVFENIKDMEGVKVTQKRLINGYILNQKQLYDIAKEIFPDEKILPVVYSLDVDDIDIHWIKNKMDDFGIKRNDLIKQLAIDKSSLSLILSGKRELSKPMRATFYYYFLTYELNRDFREYINYSN